MVQDVLILNKEFKACLHDNAIYSKVNYKEALQYSKIKELICFK